jgi:hypothetical protein
VEKMKGFIFVYDALFALIVVGVFLAGITAINYNQTESNALLLSQPTALDGATIRIHKADLLSGTDIFESSEDDKLKVCEETMQYNLGSHNTIQSCRGIK